MADDLHFPLVKIHLQSNFNLFGRIRNGNLSYIYILSTVALLILFIAGFNAIILTTLKVAKRSKETGLKKIFGAGRMTLYTQSLLESLYFSILVILMGTIVAIIIIPRLDIMPGLAGLHYNLSFTIYFILCSILLIWLITGIYPATIISGADPLNALKGKAIKNFTHVRLRMFLISLQFAISIFVLTVTFWIMSQIIFLYSAELGFDPKNIVVAPSFFHFSPYNEEFEAMTETKKSDFITGLQKVGNYVEDELTRSPLINGFTYGDNMVNPYEGQFWLNGSENTEPFNMKCMVLGQDFEKVFNMELVSGRSFKIGEGFDQWNECVINNEAAKYLNLREPLGNSIRNPYGVSFTIVGVIKNFNFEPMSMPNGPLVIFRGTNDLPMYIKVNPYHLQEGFRFIKELHKNSKSEMPFNYHLLENDYDKMNENDHRACWVLSFFSTLALIISGMGIYGLAGFQAETRTREMAIRKVFGARPKNIRLLFYLEFGRFFIIGVLLGWTLAIIVLQKYASNFVYHPNISLKPFFLSGIILAFITFLIVEIQIRLVCIKNAAETLKNE